MNKPVFEVRGFCVRPSPELKWIRIDLGIPAGNAVIIQGPSGCGKTTLLRTIARLHPAETGEALLGGKSWRSYPPREWRRKVAYIPSNPEFHPGTVRENLVLPFRLKIAFGERFPETRAREFARRLDFPEELLQRDCRVLSDGERVRVGLLRSLLLSPSVILADEPLAGLDADRREAVLDLLTSEARERGMVILLVAHDCDVARALGAEVRTIAQEET